MKKRKITIKEKANILRGDLLRTWMETGDAKYRGYKLYNVGVTKRYMDGIQAHYAFINDNQEIEFGGTIPLQEMLFGNSNFIELTTKLEID